MNGDQAAAYAVPGRSAAPLRASERPGGDTTATAPAQIEAGRLRGWLLAVVLLALLIGVYARFANLANDPAWDADEGYNWSISAHLAVGEVQLFALRYAFVQHPPAFYVLGALALRLWTQDIIALRTLTALCGVVTGVVLLGLGQNVAGRYAGSVAAVLYLIWPQAVLQSRWAYTYNLLALLFPLAILLAARAARSRSIQQGRRWQGSGLIVAGICTGVALATDQEALSLMPALLYLFWPLGLRAVTLWLLPAMAVPASYVICMVVSRPTDFLFDIQHTGTRLDLDPPILLQRLIHLVEFDPLIGLGLAGLLVLPTGRARATIWIATTTLLVVVLAIRDPAPLFRAAVPVLPLAALGLGSLAARVLGTGSRWAGQPRTPRGSGQGDTGGTPGAPRQIAILVVAACALLMVDQDVQGVHAGFPTALSPVLPRSTADARRLAQWVNTHSSPSDLVIAMPTIAWLFTARTAEILQAVAITGAGTAFYPAALAPSRFRYDTHLRAARFLVVDGYTRWAIRQLPPERALVERAMHSWSLVYRQGEYAVYANPAALREG
jgi:4-amino-4-deoxy-L-arabinose transferase-like glycosyltransferase